MCVYVCVYLNVLGLSAALRGENTYPRTQLMRDIARPTHGTLQFTCALLLWSGIEKGRFHPQIVAACRPFLFIYVRAENGGKVRAFGSLV
jgi:hypothetical protein